MFKSLFIVSAYFSARSVPLAQSCKTDFIPAEFECHCSGTGSFGFHVQLPGHFLSLSTFCTLQPPLFLLPPLPLTRQRSWHILFMLSTILRLRGHFCYLCAFTEALLNLSAWKLCHFFKTDTCM